MTMTSLENDSVSMGLARPGDLVQLKKNGQIFKVLRTLQVNYAILDEDGKEWRIKFRGVTAAPEGTVWSGPDRNERKAERERQRVAAADSIAVGDIVRLSDGSSAKDKARFPGEYLVAKRTSATRYKFIGVGTGIQFTGPATGVVKVK